MACRKGTKKGVFVEDGDDAVVNVHKKVGFCGGSGRGRRDRPG